MALQAAHPMRGTCPEEVLDLRHSRRWFPPESKLVVQGLATRREWVIFTLRANCLGGDDRSPQF